MTTERKRIYRGRGHPEIANGEIVSAVGTKTAMVLVERVNGDRFWVWSCQLRIPLRESALETLEMRAAIEAYHP